MNLTEIRNAVIAETGRADKSDMILRATRSIVLKAHQADYFPKDRVINRSVYPASSGTNEVLIALPDRWRKFEGIFRLEAGTGINLGDKFESVTPDSNLQFNGQLLPYHYWVEGSNVRLYSEKAIDRLGWNYFIDPNLTSDTASTWVTSLYAQELIDGVCGYVYRKLGDRVTAEMYMVDWRDFLARIVEENLVSEM